MANIEELQERADELAVLQARAKTHLDEVRTVNKNREDEAKRNYFDFMDRHHEAASELRRELDRVQGITRCSKCGGDINKPGGMVSDDSYSTFPCPFHKVSA